MFKSIIDSFLQSGQKATPEQEVLNLELLVYNFHESLNLKPLFRHIQRQVKDSPLRAEYMARLNRVADEVAKKQMLIIGEGGTSFDATADLKALAFRGPQGNLSSFAKDLELGGIRRNFKLEVLGADPKEEGLQLRVTVRTGQGGSVETTATEFWLDYFDFPMIDNTRLSHDQRFAVVLNNFDAAGGSADITLAFFPGKYTGLREKPYYDEVLTKLLSESEKRAPDGPPPDSDPQVQPLQPRRGARSAESRSFASLRMTGRPRPPLAQVPSRSSRDVGTGGGPRSTNLVEPSRIPFENDAPVLAAREVSRSNRGRRRAPRERSDSGGIRPAIEAASGRVARRCAEGADPANRVATEWWRRRELNPRPEASRERLLHAQPLLGSRPAASRRGKTAAGQPRIGFAGPSGDPDRLHPHLASAYGTRRVRFPDTVTAR